jgi:hypothetical protein
MLVGKIADDSVALTQPNISIVDNGRHSHRIDLAKQRILRRSVTAAPILALAVEAEFTKHPQHLMDLDRIGAAIDLEHCRFSRARDGECKPALGNREIA